MHSTMVYPRQTVYAVSCLGCSGSQAGWASSVEKGVEPPPMPRCWGEALQWMGLNTSILCTPTRAAVANPEAATRPGFQM